MSAGPLIGLIKREGMGSTAALKDVPFLGGGADVRTFQLTSAPPLFPVTVDGPGLLFAVGAQGPAFSSIAIARSVPLYAGAWTSVLIAHLASFLRPGGDLILPFADEQPATVPPLEVLSSYVGRDPDDVSEKYARFRPERVPTARPSLLGWALRSFPSITQTLMLARTASQTTDVLLRDELLLELLVDHSDLDRARALNPVNGSGTSGIDWFQAAARKGVGYVSAFDAAAQIVAWHVTAAGRRAAMLRAVLAAHALAESGLTLDVGGRYGFTAAERVLDSSLGSFAAIACDGGLTSLVGAFAAYRANRSSLYDRFRFGLRGGGDSLPDRSFLAATILGTLGDVPIDRRPALLRRVFERLEPGGVLVVHQPLRPAGDMAEDDLDRMLGNLGAVRYFASDTFAELPARGAHRSTVRVVTA